jgi:hypothetical protein
MAKLVAQNGQIEAQTRWQQDSMNVVFARKAISVSGDLGCVELTVGDLKVEMTFAQALSLAQEIMRRCQL